MSDRDAPSIWCVVANVTQETAHGPGGADKRRGTRHFAPGARLYCFPSLWGDGYESIQVVGRHRGSHRYVTMVVGSRHLANWRAELVYSPHVIAQMAGYWDGTPASRRRAEELAEWAASREGQHAAEVHGRHGEAGLHAGALRQCFRRLAGRAAGMLRRGMHGAHNS